MLTNSLKIISALLLLAAPLAQAEVISIADPRYDVANTEQGVLRPTRGMSKANVANKFGEPEHKTAAVGEPPISNWTYPEFVVYFEHNIVIHSVVPH